jgi:phosphoribosylglycinamide formyltransferase-1
VAAAPAGGGEVAALTGGRGLCDAGAVAIALAILASGSGTTAQAVIDACAVGRIDGRVVLVISNNGGAAVLERARAARIPTRHLSSLTHPGPGELERAMLDALADAGATHVLLAGYMKKLSPAVIEAYAGRVYNTHPALLPDYGGQGMYGDRVHAAVLADRRTRSGATVHLVAEAYDSGPIVAQVTVAVAADDDVASLGARVRAAERELVVEVLAAVGSGDAPGGASDAPAVSSSDARGVSSSDAPGGASDART